MGEVTTNEAYLPFRDYRTWYRVTGSLESGKLPLVVAHGGPGCTHDYVDSFKDIATLDGRPVIHYDQLGNGNSTDFRKRARISGPSNCSSRSWMPCFPISAFGIVMPSSASPGAACWVRNTQCAGRKA